MIGSLPNVLEVGGRRIAINADFRNILTIFEAYNDNTLTDEEKVYICLARLYTEPVPYYHIEEAVQQATWFLQGGDMPMSKAEDVPIIDWKHDEAIIMPAVSKALNIIDIRSIPFVHWWTFLGSFGEVGEGLLSTILHIRQSKAKGQKLSKTEEEFFRKNKDLCQLRSAEEQAAIDETEEFLKTLI